MAEELQGLLDRINKEGLEKAEEEKQRLVAEAKKEAEDIVAQAEKKAREIVAEAKAEADKLRSSGEADLHQASRDVIVSLEEELKRILASVVQASVGEAMTPDQLAEIVKTLAEAYAKGETAGLQAMASEAQVEAIRATFQTKLADCFKGGIEIKPVLGIDAGLKISFNGESVVHDFSAESVTEMLCAYLNARILEIIRKKND